MGALREWPRAARLAAPIAALLLAGCSGDRFGPTVQGPGPREMARAEPLPDNEPLEPSQQRGRIESAPLDAPQDFGQPPLQQQAPSQPQFSEPQRPTRTSATGTWRAQEASGASCRVVLASTPALDLYRASSSGCANRELSSINAWELRDGEVFLYARGGVVARLRGAGDSFSGSLAKSGAPLTLTR
jgi:hypothetical protein